MPYDHDNPTDRLIVQRTQPLASLELPRQPPFGAHSLRRRITRINRQGELVDHVRVGHQRQETNQECPHLSRAIKHRDGRLTTTINCHPFWDRNESRGVERRPAKPVVCPVGKQACWSPLSSSFAKDPVKRSEARSYVTA